MTSAGSNRDFGGLHFEIVFPLDKKNEAEFIMRSTKILDFGSPPLHLDFYAGRGLYWFVVHPKVDKSACVWGVVNSKLERQNGDFGMMD